MAAGKKRRKRRNDGSAFEQRFGTWLEEQGEYDDIEVRVRRVRGAESDHLYQVDVAARKDRPFWEAVSALGLVGSLGFFVVLIFFMKGNPQTPKAFLVLLATGAAWLIGAKKSHVRLWAECKDYRATRLEVADLALRVKDVRNKDGSASRKPMWKPEKVFLVARDFDQNALKLAKGEEIACYVETERGFVQVLPRETD